MKQAIYCRSALKCWRRVARIDGIRESFHHRIFHFPFTFIYTLKMFLRYHAYLQEAPFICFLPESFSLPFSHHLLRHFFSRTLSIFA